MARSYTKNHIEPETSRISRSLSICLFLLELACEQEHLFCRQLEDSKEKEISDLWLKDLRFATTIIQSLRLKLEVLL